MNRRDPYTCMSYWYPKLLSSGIPTPLTVLIETDAELIRMCDGELPTGLAELISQIQNAADTVIKTWPFFLRTGATSGKHSWPDTCRVPDSNESTLHDHIYEIVEFSALADIRGLSTDVWAVREMLPTDPVFKTDAGMPMTESLLMFNLIGRPSQSKQIKIFPPIGKTD